MTLPIAHRFTVPGEPMTWMRARMGKHHGGHYTPKERRERMDLILARWLALEFKPFAADEPLTISCRFWMKRPDAHFLRGRLRDEYRDAMPTNTNSGDTDNFVKLVLDALQDQHKTEKYTDDAGKKRQRRVLVQQGAFPNDAQVVHWGDCLKLYVDTPGTEDCHTLVTLARYVPVGHRLA